jgi:hypothetical protein
VIVAVIAMFIAVSTASAYYSWWKMLIRGEYAFSGSGTATLAWTGFDANPQDAADDFTPKAPEIASMGPNVWEGTYKFYLNGKGKMDARQCYNEGPPTYSSGCADISWEFEYEMDGAEITFTFIPGTYVLEYTAGPNIGLKFEPPTLTVFDQQWTGRISPDGRNLFVFYGGPFKIRVLDLYPLEIILNTVHQGFKTSY